MVRKKKVGKQKRNILFLIFLVLGILVAGNFIFSSQVSQKVEILYFRNDYCVLIYNTDMIIQEVIQGFGDKVDVKIFNARLYSNEPEDSPEVKELRERYEVIGLPDIIINGKKFVNDFTSKNLFEEICNSYLIRPEACE